MENLNLNKIEIDSSNVIGYNRYSFLKTLDPDDLTEDEILKMKAYEEIHEPNETQKENLKVYLKKVREPEPEIEFIFDKKTLWREFKIEFKNLNGVDFIETKESLENIKSLFYYFLKDESFFFCENVSPISKPSFDKGLLIMGDFGNGKTSVMLTFEKIFKKHKNYNFNSYTANEVVGIFESIGKNTDLDLTKADFDKKMYFGKRYFDDVKTEREGSNFGKVNLFKDIFENREKNNALTHVTCNFKDRFPNDVEQGLNEFEEKYGGRVYDRIFKMFNIIIFNGKSQRL